jgi:hypothetical protein
MTSSGEGSTRDESFVDKIDAQIAARADRYRREH